jgi:hypothetical protein
MGGLVVADPSQGFIERAVDVCVTVQFEGIPGNFARGFSIREQESRLEFVLSDNCP